MSSDSEDRGGWRDLPAFSFTRKDAPTKTDGHTPKDVAYNVRSAETLAAEFENRKLALGVKRRPHPRIA